MIKELAEEYEDQFECQGEKLRKTFSVQIKRELENDSK